MKKTLTGIAAVAAVAAMLGAPARAADMAVPVYKAPPPPPPCMWCGFYIGLNAGWVGSSSNTIRNAGTDTGAGGLGAALAGGAIPAAISLSNSGWLAGGTVGYNWQINPAVVFGIEGDFDGVGDKHNVTVGPFVSPFVPITTSASRDLDSLGTLRGRLGFTPGAPVLFYVTGGLAVGEHSLGIGAVAPAGAPPLNAFATTQSTTAGWTVGTGIEWKLAPQWSIKAEYLYVDLGTLNSTINYAYGGNNSTLTASIHDTYNIARAGVNWHF